MVTGARNYSGEIRNMPSNGEGARASRVNEGNALLKRGEYQAALAAFEKAITEDAVDAEAHHGRGGALRRLERYEALSLEPNHAAAHFNKGFVLDKLGRYDEAAASYERAVELEPDNAKAYNNRGVALARLERYDDALEAYERAIALRPNEAKFYYNRACTYSLCGRRDEMLADAAKAVELSPSLSKLLKADEDFRPYRDDPAFRRLVYPEERDGA